MKDLSEHMIVASISTDDAIESARALVALADLATDDTQKSSAAASAVVAAIAHVARVTEMALIVSAANKEAADGVMPALGRAERSLPVSLRARMRQLVIETFGPGVELDEAKPKTRLLVEAIKYRNKLIHHPGTFRIGSLKDFDTDLSGDHVELRIPLPGKDWRAATHAYARSVVEAVEGYVEVVLHEESASSPLSSQYVAEKAQRSDRRLSGRDGASPRH